MNVNRRDGLRTLLGLGAAVGPLLSWPGRLAAQLKAQNSGRKLIVLWMPGGPSQMDTFDLKPAFLTVNHQRIANIRSWHEVASEYLPGLSKLAEHLSIVRGMQTKEGDHSRGTYFVPTGQRPGNPLRYPALPSALAKELSAGGSAIPGYVSILPNTFINPPAFSSGF